ncbi:MAG: hypothetical protein IBX68_10500, partial [Dehalococcoidia bacterium]|nr:hypothetical protein [Dehalococcoidia bacterium]
VIIVGCLAFAGYTLNVSNENRNKSAASLEAQYVGFWISEDVIQAQRITLEDSDGTGFPLVLEWDDPENGETCQITYTFDRDQGHLSREQKIRAGIEPGPEFVSLGKAYVGQNLDPDRTRCYKKEYEFVNSLMLEVTAIVHGRTASNEYEIHPRAFSLWFPEVEE